MSEIRSASKPNDLTCERCNSHVEAVHTGTATEPSGRQVEVWTQGECRNPQCSLSARPAR